MRIQYGYSVMMKAGLNVMKLYIGWSGETGGKIADILGKWLFRTFDNHITVVSVPSSIEIGSDWRESLDEMMNAVDCVLLCVTEDTVNSQSLAYEAGMFSRNAQFVVSLLFDVDALSLRFPLSVSHPVSFGEDGMRELTRKLNGLLGEDALPAEELEESFQARFPTLEMLVTDTLEENEPQTREDWTRNELDEISAQLAALTKRVERLKTNVSAASRSRKSSYRKTSKTSRYL